MTPDQTLDGNTHQHVDFIKHAPHCSCAVSLKQQRNNFTNPLTDCARNECVHDVVPDRQDDENKTTPSDEGPNDEDRTPKTEGRNRHSTTRGWHKLHECTRDTRPLLREVTCRRSVAEVREAFYQPLAPAGVAVAEAAAAAGAERVSA